MTKNNITIVYFYKIKFNKYYIAIENNINNHRYIIISMLTICLFRFTSVSAAA